MSVKILNSKLRGRNRTFPLLGLVSHEKYDQPCLNAGAAATLIRPVRADQIFAVLQSLNVPASLQTPPIDIDRIMTRVGGRKQILKKMVDIFIEELPGPDRRIASCH